MATQGAHGVQFLQHRISEFVARKARQKGGQCFEESRPQISEHRLIYSVILGIALPVGALAQVADERDRPGRECDER